MLKVKQIFLLTALAIVPHTTVAQKQGVENEYRKFTGANGKIIQAVLVNRDDENNTAELLLKNGRRATVPLDKLSTADQKYVKSWNKEKAIFLKSCRGLTVKQLLELRGYEPIKFRLEGNAILFNGKIAGKPARIQIDTGAGTSVLNVSYARKIGLEVGPMKKKIYGVAGEADAGDAKVPSLKFGETELLAEVILAADLEEDRKKGSGRNDILLGAEYLTQLETVISYKEGYIFFRPDLADKNRIEAANGEKPDITDDVKTFSFRIFKTKSGKSYRGKMVGKTESSIKLVLTNGKKLTLPASGLSPADANYAFNWSEEKAMFMQHCRSLTVEELLELRQYESFQYERRRNHIYVDGLMNDKKVTWMIDTGADMSLLHLHAAKENNCKVGDMDKKVYGIGGEAPAAVCEVKKINIGTAVLTNRNILGTDLARFVADDKLGYVGLFGADFMRELEAVITYRERRIFLKQKK